jgi:hypothetical protein
MRRALMLAVLAACSSGGSEDCAQLGTQAKAFANAKLDQFGGGCTTDFDCVLIRASLSCYNGCPRAVMGTRQATAQGELSGLSTTLCGSSSCVVNEGCSPVHAECVVGACRTVPGARDAGLPDAGGSDAG